MEQKPSKMPSHIYSSTYIFPKYLEYRQACIQDFIFPLDNKMLSLVTERYLSVFNLSSKYPFVKFILISFWWLTTLFSFTYDLRVYILSPNGRGLEQRSKFKIFLRLLLYVLENKSDNTAKSNQKMVFHFKKKILRINSLSNQVIEWHIKNRSLLCKDIRRSDGRRS